MPPPRRPIRGRWIPSSLGRRLLLGAGLGIVLALVLTGVAMEVTLRRFVQAQVDGRVDGQLLTVADALRARPDGGIGLVRSVDGPPFDRQRSGWYWQVLAPEPVFHSRSLGPDPLESGPAEQHGPPGSPMTATGLGPGDEPLRIRLRHVRVGSVDVTVVATAPQKALDGPLRDVMAPVAFILALLGAGLLGGVLLQVRLGLRPLGRLRKALVLVRSGLAERVSGPQPQEVRPLVDELNLLLDENRSNLERARRNVANLAHGLKTPLATLALALDERGSRPQAELRPLVDRMDRLIRHHLARARAAALGGSSRARAPLREAVEGHVAVFSKLYADKSLAFDLRLDAGLAVAVEAQDLDELLGNLLDNAAQWARSRIAVTGLLHSRRITLDIEDDGPGVPPDRMGDMLKPGQRIDESAPGHGFGLPITRELAELYGGSLSLSRSAAGGLKATLDLPAASSGPERVTPEIPAGSGQDGVGGAPIQSHARTGRRPP